jgi:RimJ/RimL family protein N-acetyltransferase
MDDETILRQVSLSAWNQRAIYAYQKAGFAYVKTIKDEIAYSNHMEDFWVMELL